MTHPEATFDAPTTQQRMRRARKDSVEQIMRASRHEHLVWPLLGDPNTEEALAAVGQVTEELGWSPTPGSPLHALTHGAEVAHSWRAAHTPGPETLYAELLFLRALAGRTPHDDECTHPDTYEELLALRETVAKPQIPAKP